MIHSGAGVHVELTSPGAKLLLEKIFYLWPSQAIAIATRLREIHASK
jgi:hypothetical protein